MIRRVVRPPVEREVDEEFAFHVDMRVRELVAQGWDEDAARAEAVRRFGDIDRVKADCRDLGHGREVRMGRRAMGDEFRQDVAWAWRQARRAPGFAGAVVVTLALAIGCTTAVFSVARAVLLRPLPYDHPEQLEALWTRYLPESGFDIDRFPLSGPEFLDYQESTETFASLGAWGRGTRALTGGEETPERVSVAFFSADVFPMLGIPPLLGRWISPEEDLPEAPPVVVLGHGLWSRRFGADPDVVGRTLRVNGVDTRVVGVMPRDFSWHDAEAWLPLGMDRTNQGGRAGHGTWVVGRRRPGVTSAEVEAELAVVRERWAAEYEHNQAHYVWSRDLKEDRVGSARDILTVLAVAAALILLIATANTANLLLARGEGRAGEVALRRALGAGRGRLARQLLTEGALLATVAAALGIPLAMLTLRGVVAVDPEALPRLDQVGIDGTVLAFTFGVALMTALLFGVVPALLSTRGGDGMASAGPRTAGSRSATLLRRGLVAGEIALALVVAILAGLTTRSLGALTSADLGFEAAGRATFDVTLPRQDYPDDARVPADFERLFEGLEAIPGVIRVAGGSTLPLSGGSGRWDFQLDDRPPRGDGDPAWSARVAMVTPGYFETLEIPVLAGRLPTRADGPDDPPVVVVSESMARAWWPEGGAVGQRVGYARTDDDGRTVVPWATIVGVVVDQYQSSVDEEVLPEIYLPATQAGITGYVWPRSLSVVVETAGDPEARIPALRSAVAAFDPDLPVSRPRALARDADVATATPRLTANLLGLFGSLALVLAVVGIYGLVAFSVASRTREIGIRTALGAERGQVVRMVVEEGARPIVAGLAVGLLGAWLGSRLVASMLYGVEPTDPLTYVALPLTLLTVALGATLIPALRAASVPPTEALRE